MSEPYCLLACFVFTYLLSCGLKLNDNDDDNNDDVDCGMQIVGHGLQEGYIKSSISTR